MEKAVFGSVQSLQVQTGKRRRFLKKQWKNQDVPRKEVWKDVGMSQQENKGREIGTMMSEIRIKNKSAMFTGGQVT